MASKYGNMIDLLALQKTFISFDCILPDISDCHGFAGSRAGLTGIVFILLERIPIK